MNTKNEIRQYFKKARSALTVVQQNKASHLIFQQIVSLALYQKAEHIGVYQAVGKEIDLKELYLHALLQHKKTYLPVIQANETLHFVEFDDLTPLTCNQFNILEPRDSASFPIETLDILFLPLVAFDKIGNRLGQGKGYYDKTLKHQKPKHTIGVAYAFQYYPDLIPCDSWDVALDGIITEESIIWFNSAHLRPSPLF